MLKEILDNLSRTHFSMCTHTEVHTNTNTCARTHPVPPPSRALSGTSLNIHHSGCSESAINAASHSRESLKPTLSSALPPSLPSVTHTHTQAHAHTSSHSQRQTHVQQHSKAPPVALLHAQTHICTQIKLYENTRIAMLQRTDFAICACVRVPAAPSTEV